MTRDETKRLTLSLVIPCYNADYHLLPDLLKEFSNQTKAPTEIIISSSGLQEPINTPAPDNLTIADKLIPIIHVNNEARMHAAGARNRGAEKASSHLIMFFDVDDIPHPQKIELTLKAFSENTISAFVHSFTGPHHSIFHSIDHSLIESIPLYPITRKNPTCSNVYSDCPPGVDHALHHGHITIKKSLFNTIKFDEASEWNSGGEDGKFCQDIVDTGIDFMQSPAKLVHYK